MDHRPDGVAVVPSLLDDSLDRVAVRELDLSACREDQQLRPEVPGHLVDLLP